MRPGFVALAFGLLAATASAGSAAVDTASAGSPPSPDAVSWQSAGDSYSSGEGVFGNVGDCAQSDAAYGPLSVDRLTGAGWTIDSETFTACTGSVVADYFNAREDTGGKTSLWDWGREQGGPERVDVVTMSFGGNDIGFADVLADCLVGLPDSWGELLLGGVAGSLTGCDVSEEELSARVDALVDPTRRDCTGTRATGEAGFDCDLQLAGRRGSIIDFYYDVVSERLTPRGRLYVVGYPSLFAPVAEWPGWVKVTCQGVKRGDAEKVARVSTLLDAKLAEAVARANQALGAERVVYIDRLGLYRDGGHELCGSGEDWLNGIAVDRGEGAGVRTETSFHPNAAGHDAVATLLVGRVQETFPRPAPVELDPGVELRNTAVPALCGHPAGTLVDGSLPIEAIPGQPDPGFVSVGETYFTGELDDDPDPEYVTVVSCSQGGVAFPQLLLLHDSDFSVRTVVDTGTLWPDVSTWRSGVESVSWNGSAFDVDVVLESSAVEPTVDRSLVIDGFGCVVLIDARSAEPYRADPTTGDPCGSAPAPADPVEPAVAPASCVSGELSPYTEGRRGEIALYQTTLASLGFDPGEIDGYFGENTLSAAWAEIQANGNIDGPEGVFAEFFPDDGAVLPGAFERLGIACASEPAGLTASQAEEHLRDYLLAAGARRYEEAWAMLGSAYQDEYGGYGPFVRFWDRVDVVGINSTDVIARSGGTVTLEADLWFDVNDGEDTSEIVHIDIARVDGRPLITDYRFIRLS